MQASKRWQVAQNAAERYESVLVPAILGPFARALVDHSGVRGGGSAVAEGGRWRSA